MRPAPTIQRMIGPNGSASEGLERSVQTARGLGVVRDGGDDEQHCRSRRPRCPWRCSRRRRTSRCPSPAGSPAGRSRCFLNAFVMPRTMNAMPIAGDDEPDEHEQEHAARRGEQLGAEGLRRLRRVGLAAQRVHERGDRDRDVGHGGADELDAVAPLLLRVGVALEEGLGDLPDRECEEPDDDDPQQEDARGRSSRICSIAPPWSASPPPPVATEIAITPMTMCRMPSTT